MTFSELRLIQPLLEALHTQNYSTPTPIQMQSIPHLLDGKDIFGCAQTGTGKTAAFALPILQHLANSTSDAKGIQALVLAPTRELALQIEKSFSNYGKQLNISHTVVFGGVSQHHQTIALQKGVQVLVATPGRLLDLMQQGFIRLDQVKYFVLDEADRMLDMGFINDIRKIIAKLPQNRQTIFFSATVSPEIMSLANTLLKNPVKVSVTPVATPAETVHQSVFYVQKEDKRSLLKHVIK